MSSRPTVDHSNTSYPAGASWASLIDFFKSPVHGEPIHLPPPPNDSPSRLSPHIKPPQFSSSPLPSLSTSNLGGLRSRPARRDSETINLRTGEYLDRPLASGTGRFRGAVGSFAKVIQGLRPDSKVSSQLSRNDSLTSLGPRGERHEWDARSGMSEVEEEINDSQEPPRLRQPSLAEPARRLAGSSFIDYRISTSAQTDHRNPTQMPISPPPHPVRVGFAELSMFPALMPDPPHRQLSTYKPKSRRPVVNPFASPFDGPGET